MFNQPQETPKQKNTEFAVETEVAQWEASLNRKLSEVHSEKKPYFFTAPKNVINRLFPFLKKGEFVNYKGFTVCADDDLDQVQKEFSKVL